MRAAIGGGQEPSRGPGREGEAGGGGKGGGQYILTTRTQRAGLANRADARRGDVVKLRGRGGGGGRQGRAAKRASEQAGAAANAQPSL